MSPKTTPRAPRASAAMPSWRRASRPRDEFVMRRKLGDEDFEARLHRNRAAAGPGRGGAQGVLARLERLPLHLAVELDAVGPGLACDRSERAERDGLRLLAFHRLLAEHFELHRGGG